MIYVKFSQNNEKSKFLNLSRLFQTIFQNNLRRIIRFIDHVKILPKKKYWTRFKQRKKHQEKVLKSLREKFLHDAKYRIFPRLWSSLSIEKSCQTQSNISLQIRGSCVQTSSTRIDHIRACNSVEHSRWQQCHPALGQQGQFQLLQAGRWRLHSKHVLRWKFPGIFDRKFDKQYRDTAMPACLAASQ